MSYQIRPSVPDDGPAIVAVLRKAGLNPISEEQSLHWKYWRERADWAGPRSLVLTKGGEVVAHAGIVPGSLAWGERRASVIHVIDWAAVPEAALGGTMLMKYVGGLADVLLAVGGSADTLRLLPVLGFRRCGTSHRYVRTLHPLRYLMSPMQWDWKTLPKLARGALSAFGAAAAERGAWASRQLAARETQALAAVLPRASGQCAVLERSPAALSYFLDCPIAEVTLHSVEHAGKIRGYFLLACVFGQARLVDSWLDRADSEAWYALVQCAVSAARAVAGVAELVTTECDPTVSRCLQASRFRQRSEIPIHMLLRKGLDAPVGCPRVQMLDNDAAYHHPGFAEFWT